MAILKLQTKKRGPVVIISILVFVAASLVATNIYLSKPNDKTKQDKVWLQAEAKNIFGGLGQLAPQKVHYFCDIPRKIIGGCHIEAAPTFVGNNPEVEKYINFGHSLPPLLVAKGWRKYQSQNPTPETSKNSQGKLSLQLSYNKTERQLYCELSYVVENGTLSSYPGNYATWYMRCKST